MINPLPLWATSRALGDAVYTKPLVNHNFISQNHTAQSFAQEDLKTEIKESDVYFISDNTILIQILTQCRNIVAELTTAICHVKC